MGTKAAQRPPGSEPPAVSAVTAQAISVAGYSVAVYMLYQICFVAYDIRLYAIKNYGAVIHEFDPWFNFRATEYLANNGWEAFSKWFDYLSWYPLGRPVATTIYPGMQIAGVAIHEGLSTWVPDQGWTLNDVCCYIPAWFGVSATLCLAGLAYETSGQSTAAAVGSAAVMSIIPAHLSRSIGGGFDNESVAVTFMCATFWLWNRALRGADVEDAKPASEKSSKASFLSATFYGILAGLAYVAMAASWGGYVFVINMVGLHAIVLLGLGKAQSHLHPAYTAFFIVGTFGAVQVPVVGWAPLRSMEQLMPLGVFGLVQLQALRKMLGSDLIPKILAACAVACGAALLFSGYFGAFSQRVAALFGAHATRTGNPLVDSVAEHQPSSPGAYFQYLDRACFLAPFGLVPLFRINPDGYPTTTGFFAVLFSGATYFFSMKMSRLMIFMGPPTSLLCGIMIGAAFDWTFDPMYNGITVAAEPGAKAAAAAAAAKEEVEKEVDSKKSTKKQKKDKKKTSAEQEQQAELAKAAAAAAAAATVADEEPLFDLSGTPFSTRLMVAGVVAALGFTQASAFYQRCDQMAQYQLSSPQIMYKAQGGRIVDDYREAYWWLRDNTAEDARVMAWWDYGYQIAGIANRTTIADGNTWNHEHIGMLGLCLTSPVDEAHAIARHLADYVLVWIGGGSDDLGKSTHMARISNSVYKGHCSETDCREYGHGKRGASTMMSESLMWHLSARDAEDGKTFVDTDKFKQVYQSVNGLVRIVQVLQVSEESKAWGADPTSRECDAPGSWYCPGTYSPALQALFATDGDGDGGVSDGSSSNDDDGNDGAVVDDAGLSEAALYKKRYTSRLKRQDGERAKPNEANLPSGSFQGSCKGCSINRDTNVLTCTHCRARGVTESSSLDLNTCKREINNMAGELQCTPEPNEKGLPQGGYLRSCLGCKMLNRGKTGMDGAKVSCTNCGAHDGTQLRAEYPMVRCPSPGYLDNDNGILKCYNLPNAADIPDGGYRHSCSGCKMMEGDSHTASEKGRKLFCSHCGTADGRQLVAHMFPNDCNEVESVDNNNGRLVCK